MNLSNGKAIIGKTRFQFVHEVKFVFSVTKSTNDAKYTYECSYGDVRNLLFRKNVNNNNVHYSIFYDFRCRSFL